MEVSLLPEVLIVFFENTLSIIVGTRVSLILYRTCQPNHTGELGELNAQTASMILWDISHTFFIN